VERESNPKGPGKSDRLEGQVGNEQQGAIVNAAVAINPVTSVADFRGQPAVSAAVPSVPTDIPAAQAINPAANIPATRNDSRRADKAAPGTSRVVFVDPQTNAIVYRSLDASTGAIIEQVPARALLRQRAYVNAQAVQALISGKSLTQAVVAASQEVDTTA
jgi:hypothetical protein